MKRVLLLIPDGLTFDMLTQEQQDAINRVFGQYVMPMPYTHSHLTYQVCDAVCADSFDPSKMGMLGLTWEIIGMWQWDGLAPRVTELVPLDESKFMDRLDPEYDENGDPLPLVLREPHKWAGWEDCF